VNPRRQIDRQYPLGIALLRVRGVRLHDPGDLLQ
jgi:hypothetical protein